MMLKKLYRKRKLKRLLKNRQLYFDPVYKQGYNRAIANADRIMLEAMNVIMDGDSLKAHQILSDGIRELSKGPNGYLYNINEEVK